ncbi:hypothetical protein [Candidatus Mycolicibacterium alkanivorans]|uniref:Lipoprotein n=1 Tax=Candidatus Mycolicibacterium alkanivorans TaxID=2954114 RepID=A0ABS9YTL0_9MYCO|nr:hypothetical protein [Candidatus Mycolicibacterium alkanivorans]MCI4674227.1 hypothetical protein [Candidatus Mycolicibacterium alkanivorans]
MTSSRLTRQIALFAGGLAIIGMGSLTACGKSKEKAPETTSPTSTSAPAPSPTEKAVSPSGPNSFTPTVKAPPAPTAVPGHH